MRSKGAYALARARATRHEKPARIEIVGLDVELAQWILAALRGAQGPQGAKTG